MGVFPNKHNFKGCVLDRKVRLNANMYSFNFFFSALKAFLCLDQNLTFDRGELFCGVYLFLIFYKSFYSFLFLSESLLNRGRQSIP